MPFEDVSAMSQRLDFVCLALGPQANIRELCRRFGISSRTGYKWIHRYQQDGIQALQEQSRRPKNSPRETPQQMQEQIRKLREKHPAWGARKLAARLNAMGQQDVPHPSTITQILRRADLIDPKQSDKHKAHQRFERSEPNALWQMDFKGHLPMGERQSLEEGQSVDGRCHPLTILDDHSRFSLCIAACANERYETVRDVLIPCFERYGMPYQILCDNGAPFGSPYSDTGIRSYTRLEVWLMRQQITTIHGRPAHPQTQGKDERFHRTLKSAVLQGQVFTDLANAQLAFDAFREVYNHERPHQAIGLDVPVSRYRPSQRPYPEVLPEPQYDSGLHIRKVSKNGMIHFKDHRYPVGKALRGQYVALVPDPNNDGLYTVYFFQTIVGGFDLRLDQHID